MVSSDKVVEASESLFDSLRSHVLERSKSPFAGAFLLAWFAVNWEAIFTLMLSTKSIEARIEFVRSAFTQGNTVWLPLAVSLVLMAGFYIGSLAIALLRHIYDLVRGVVARRFEGRGWIERSTHLAMKQAYLQRIEEAERLAADNKQEILEEKEKVVGFERQLEECARELESAKQMLLRKGDEIADLENRRKVAADYMDVVRAQFTAAQQNNEKLSKAISSLLEPIGEVMGNAKLIEARLQQGAPYFGHVPISEPDGPPQGLRRLVFEPKKSQFFYDESAVAALLNAAQAIENSSRDSQARIADALSNVG